VPISFSNGCHSEQSEESRLVTPVIFHGILRYAQDDIFKIKMPFFSANKQEGLSSLKSLFCKDFFSLVFLSQYIHTIRLSISCQAPVK